MTLVLGPSIDVHYSEIVFSKRPFDVKRWISCSSILKMGRQTS